MLNYLKKYWLFCLLAPLFMIGEVSMDLLQPSMMAEIVDQGVMKQDISLIISLGIKMIIAVFLGGISGIICNIFANLAAQNFGNDLRKDLFRKIIHLSFKEISEFSTGSLITRLSSDVTQVQQTVMMAVRGFVRNSVMLAGGIYMLYRQSGEYALVAALFLPFVVGFIIFFLKKASPKFCVVQKKLDGIHQLLQETIIGARVIKAYAREDEQKEKFGQANTEYYRINMSVQYLLAFLSPCMNIILNLCIVGVIFVGGYSVKNHGSITPGQTMASITYLAQILHGITFMANIFQTFTRSKASADRIKEVLFIENSIAEGKGIKTEEEKGTIEFKHVFFSYSSDENYVLKDISFQIKEGETFGIIGTTGSGKSTLVHLIPRFYDVSSGEILVDGCNVKEYPLSVLREKISIVLQKPELYSRSLKDNILWSKSGACEEEVKYAASIAQAHQFIEESIQGYDTLVTERGHSLSGGQKQRISIARTLLKNHEILIFDDATNALDLKTESMLYEALEKAYPGKTKMIIAQRIATVLRADRIVVLDSGQILAIGSHEELMESCSLYKEIFASQQREGEVWHEG